MLANEIFALSENGDPVLLDLLDPFFQTVWPAFQAAADEIRTSASLADIKDLKMEYTKGGMHHPLKTARDFHPFVTSARIRILTKMSIGPVEGAQRGILPISFRGTEIKVNVEIVIQDNREIMILKPVWE